MKPQNHHTLPEGWKVKRLGEIADFKNGLNYSQENSGRGLKVIGVSDFKENFTIKYDSLEELSGFDEIHESYLLKNNDILFVRSNGSKNLIGRAVFIENLNERVSHSGFTIRARFKANEILPVLAAYYFQMGAFKKQLLSEGGGTNISNLSQVMLAGLPIPLPPLPEQRQIAVVLGTWDRAIEQTTELLKVLRTRHRGLMHQLLTGKKRLPGFEGEWRKVNADEVFKSVSIRNHPNEPLLSATQERGVIPRSMLEGRVTMPESDTNNYKLVVPGDFIISLRSFQGGIESSDYRGIVSPAYTVLKPTKEIEGNFYRHYFKSLRFIQQLGVAVIGIRDGKQISFEDFSAIEVPNPTIEEQHAIARVLDVSLAEIRQQQAKLNALREQKRGLMQCLLTGQARVPVNLDNHIETV